MMVTKDFVLRMTEQRKPNPTPAELELLQLLWQSGPATVRQIHERLAVDKAVGYTTVLKMLQIMTEKGLVRRAEEARAHVYEAAQSEFQAERQIVGDLLDRVFSGAAERLVMHALSDRKASAEELAEIRRLLDRLEEEQGE
jgi:predicted transcriptional regulator